MSWVISVEEEDGQRIYVRRIAPSGFVSFTVDRADAKRFPTKADARAAVVKTGLTRLIVRDAKRDT